MMSSTHILGSIQTTRDFAVKQREVIGENCRSSKIHTWVSELRSEFGITVRRAGEGTTATIDYSIYTNTCKSYDCQALTRDDLSALNHVYLLEEDNDLDSLKVGDIQDSSLDEKEDVSDTNHSLNTLIGLIRDSMETQGILRLEITQENVLADLVKTVSLNL